MSEERTRILKMIAQGKITAEEGEKLLDALNAPVPVQETEQAHKTKSKIPQFIYVKVVSSNDDNVDVKVPLGLIRAGVKLTSLIPQHARDKINQSMGEHGVDFDLNKFKPEDLDDLIKHLTEMEINVNAGNGDTVRVYCA